ncbi:MAG: glycoside hydrolase family 5 protein [Treponema sp.]|nr:glycoside hydrolase family 5 protein [Treponema sp.]
MRNLSKLIIIIAAFVFAACNTSEKPHNPLIDAEMVEPALLSAPFSKGVNFSMWFEAADAGRIPFTQYTEYDFQNAKSMGVDVIRMPVRLHDMTSGAPNYRLQPLLLKLLDMAVDWAEKYGLYIIIDNHSFSPDIETSDDINKVLIPVWEQIAQRYRNRSDYVVYEILNEPHGISYSRWGEIQGMALAAIRKYDQKHWVIVGGTEWNSYNQLYFIPDYKDSKLIYTFHYYDPFLFTHQGAGWSPPLQYLSGVPFPYDSKRMPSVPSELKGTWVEYNLTNYSKDASPAKLLDILDKVAAFSRQRNVPVFCGEYGVFIPNSHPEDRVRWYEFITNALDRRNISRTSWDYYGGFGIFNKNIKGDFFSDLNVDLVKAMKFNPPRQVPRDTSPLKTGFLIFDDFTERDIAAGFWGDEDAVFSFYDSNTADGEFAIRCYNAGLYNNFWFAFSRNGNLSELASKGFYVEFMARAEQAVRFDVRFLMPENQSSIPWRMSYLVDEKILPPDGRWHTIHIPLKAMYEQGAWINSTQTWMNPKGEFSWRNVEKLEFSIEHEGLKGRSFWIDSIKITQ